MYFCPNCNSNLDITKKIKNPFIREYNDSTSYINDILNKETSGTFIFNNLNINEIQNNKLFKSQTQDIKQEIIGTFKDHTNKMNKVYFICNTCDFHKLLSSGITIYKKTIPKDLTEDIERQNIKKYDNTLPRTKDFICPNNLCSSNKKENFHKKEAIFYRPYNDLYYLKYLCTACDTSWSPFNKLK